MPVVFYDHQLAAISWMAKVESRRRFVPEQPQGGILAHAMGLGKTASMLGWIDQSPARITLVVCPKSVLQQWREEALKVTRMELHEIVVYHGSNRNTILEQKARVRIMLTTFDIVRLDHAIYEDKKTRKNTVFETSWDRIVVDEAHHICEQGSKTAKAIRSLRSANRWCITGTPFKNGVSDLVALAKFLCVTPYNDPAWWRVYSKNRVKIREWRDMFLNIQGKDVLDLPPVTFCVENCVETEGDAFLLDALDDVNTLRIAPEDLTAAWYNDPDTTTPKHELLKILRLRQLANHPLMLVPTPVSQFLCNSMGPPLPVDNPPLGRLPGNFQLGVVDAVQSNSRSCTSSSSSLSSGLNFLAGESAVCDSCDTMGYDRSVCDAHSNVEFKSSMVAETSGVLHLDVDVTMTDTEVLSVNCLCCNALVTSIAGVNGLCARHAMCQGCLLQNIMCPICLIEPLEHEEGWIHSSKTKALANYVRQYPGDKMVLFSQWTTCLDLLLIMFRRMGVSCTRYDGRVNSLDERTEIIQHFKDSPTCRILLTSLGAGGEGLNLTCATHVILMEPYWNCAVEQQAIDRVHRIGQTLPVHVLRLIMQSRKPGYNSIEQWVLDIQRYKTRELHRLLWGEESTSPVKYITRNGNVQMRNNDSQVSSKMKFNEPRTNSVYTQKSSTGNLVRFLRQPNSKKIKQD